MPLCAIMTPRDRISLHDAVKSYLFNSQIVTLPSGEMALIAPLECEENNRVLEFLQEVQADSGNPISQIHYLDLRGSMRNGGGPACLRLRVVLGDEAWTEGVVEGVKITPANADILEKWIKRHYREELYPAEMATLEFLEESQRALDELTQIMGLGSLYPFQKIT
jgi:succinylarginine dihydrolase